MKQTSVIINGKSLLPEIQKRVLAPEIPGEAGQILSVKEDGTTEWVDNTGGGADLEARIAALEKTVGVVSDLDTEILKILGYEVNATP